MDDGPIELPDFKSLPQKVVDELFPRIVNRTPINTGRARDGWVKDNTTISNNVPYIGVLENGSSDQAPEGMVRVSLEEIPQIIAEITSQETKK
jgi:hypothetical protein